jgi:hypothetical protein
MGFSGQPAQAEEEGQKIMRQLDEEMTKAQDQMFTFDLVTQEPGKEKEILKLKVFIKGKKFRRIEFLEPANMKGVRFLVISITQMYTYLPAYKRVRRVASHVRSQGFMNTAYGFDEMSIVVYGDVFDAELVGETDTLWKLKGIRKKDQTFYYAGIELDVLKKNFHPVVIRYFNAKGAKLKTETRYDFQCQQEICSPRVMRMTDHVRGDIYSELIRTEWKVNTGIKDSFFSVQSLQRGK